MRSWIARHPISFMALYTVFYLTAFHWLEVNITVPAIWVHCQLDDVIPFCKYAIVPYFAWFAWIPFTLFYLLRHGERSDFWRVCLCLFAGMTIALSCYVLLPTGLALRPCRVYGTTTHKDLTGWGPRLMMALVAMIVTSLVGALFGFGFGTSVLYCGIGLVVFMLLTAYDTQKLRQIYAYYAGDAELAEKASIYGALTLYLDFINIFLYVVRLLGMNSRSRNN